MERAPITRQRSPWEEFEHADPVPGYASRWYRRRVGDGVLYACVADEPNAGGWHMSISHRSQNGRLVRYPRWDEIAQARDDLLPADVGFVMHLPPAGQYVALHDTTFHLHEYPERSSS